MAAIVEPRTGIPGPWQTRALEQRCACLVRLGNRAALEELARDNPHPAVGYHLALALALENQIDAAAAQLKTAIRQQPEYPGVRSLAFRVALRQADLKLEQQDWNGVSSAVALALEAGPAGPEGERELLRFKSALPVSHIKAGNRRQAAEIWERELRDQPGNRALIHNLAILHYWWAAEEEAKGGGDADSIWSAAIAYWSLMVNCGELWSQWKAQLERRWGIRLEESDLQPARDTFLNERLSKLFSNNASAYREQGRMADAERHEDYLTAVLLEKRSAEALKTLAEPPVGGVLHYRRQGLLQEIAARIDRSAQPGEEQQKLRIYFSPEGLGRILVLIEEQQLPDKALERLARMPAAVQNSADARYLRIRALQESAKACGKRNASADALRQAEVAWTEAQSQPATAPWISLKASLDTLLVAAAQHETARLRKESQLDQAIAMLERLHGQSRLAGIRESLCIAYTDRGQENLAAQAWDAARAGFQKALDLDASCLPAKQGMCRAYNNEAMAIEDKEKALPLLQKAIEYDPDNTAVRDNLAQEFNAKAVRLLNAPNCSVDDVNRAMGLLQAGGLTIRPDLDEPFFETFVIRSGAGYEEEIHKLPEGVFKWILGNLQIACKRRENFALEFNSKAVAILNAPGCSSRDAGEAINLLRAAALTTRPDLSRQYVDTFIAGDGAGYAEEISKLPEGAFRLILQNLQVACQRRRS